MNSLTSLLVHLDAGPRTETRLRVARALAAQHEAALSAVYAVTPVFMQVPMDMAGGGAAAALLQEVDEERSKATRARYDRVCAEPGIPVAWIEPGEVLPVAAVMQQAFGADLMVLGQHDPDLDTAGVPADFVESVLIASGRPALVLPYIGVRGPIGQTVLVAWKNTASSARALAAALPLLQAARSVHLLTDAAEDSGPVQQYLQRHRITAQAHRLSEAGANAGELMLSQAADVSADLLVMGCYGHTRARELVLGGATRSVLRSMTLPVLMAH